VAIERGAALANARRYEQVAARIGWLIEQGTLPPGGRVPSVRALSQQQGVSVSTVVQAYRLLEDRGLIEGRPQSGYYVRGTTPEPWAVPTPDSAAPRPTEVSAAELMLMVLRDIGDPRLVPLGAAVPNVAMLPAAKLHRLLTAISRRSPERGVAYDSPAGCLELRVQVARRALATGCVLTPDDILTTNGCQEAVNLALQAVCQPGDAVAVESPTYYGLLQSVETLGLRAVEIPTHPREGISLNALRYALAETPVRAAVVMTNFSNPLGTCLSDARKQELVALLAEHDVPLIEDDIYGDLCFGPERPRVAKAYDRRGQVLLCSSFSKTLAPGYRVGWIAAGQYQARVEQLKVARYLATATLPQLAIAEFLANGSYDYHLRTMRRAYARQAAAVVRAVRQHFPAGTRVVEPAGGMVVWVELPGAVDARELYARARQAGITVAPGPLFSAKARYRSCVRLSAAWWSPTIARALRTLGALACELCAVPPPAAVRAAVSPARRG
jgi:DNA-binding transcriptional MocR family regulator